MSVPITSSRVFIHSFNVYAYTNSSSVWNVNQKGVDTEIRIHFIWHTQFSIAQSQQCFFCCCGTSGWVAINVVKWWNTLFILFTFKNFSPDERHWGMLKLGKTTMPGKPPPSPTLHLLHQALSMAVLSLGLASSCSGAVKYHCRHQQHSRPHPSTPRLHFRLDYALPYTPAVTSLPA